MTPVMFETRIVPAMYVALQAFSLWMLEMNNVLGRTGHCSWDTDKSGLSDILAIRGIALHRCFHLVSISVNTASW